jgi:hypothetical protein
MGRRRLKWRQAAKYGHFSAWQEVCERPRHSKPHGGGRDGSQERIPEGWRAAEGREGPRSHRPERPRRQGRREGRGLHLPGALELSRRRSEEHRRRSEHGGPQGLDFTIPRRIINITGGTFAGERLSGRILPGGADWQIIRADGAADLDARYTLESATGALIQVRSQGLRHGPPEVLAALAAGQPVDPSRYYFRTVLRLETGSVELDWLNRVVAVARGARLPRAVQLNVFEVL